MSVEDYLKAYNITLTLADVRFIHLCRLVGYGSITSLTVHDGTPARADRTVTNFDFRKELAVRPVPKDPSDP